MPLVSQRKPLSGLLNWILAGVVVVLIVGALLAWPQQQDSALPNLEFGTNGTAGYVDGVSDDAFVLVVPGTSERVTFFRNEQTALRAAAQDGVFMATQNDALVVGTFATVRLDNGQGTALLVDLASPPEAL